MAGRKKKTAHKRRGARLGQHFLIAPWAAHTLVEAAHVQPGTLVVEVGPGTGNLTKEILRAGGVVIAIEKDPILITTLKTRFNTEILEGRLRIVAGDIRDMSTQKLKKYLPSTEYVVAANIPYYITGEIIRSFLESKTPPRHMALLVQKEVAQRVARDPKESILSVSVKAYGTPRYVKTVSKGCFSPPPSVDSAILSIENITHTRFTGTTQDWFFTVVKRGFASKRKMVGGNLKEVCTEEVLRMCGVEPSQRAETITLEQWFCIARQTLPKKTVGSRRVTEKTPS